MTRNDVVLSIITLVASLGIWYLVVDSHWVEPEEAPEFSFSSKQDTGFTLVEDGQEVVQFLWKGKTVWKIRKLNEDNFLFEMSSEAETWPNLQLWCGPVIDKSTAVDYSIEMRTEGRNSPNIVSSGPVTLKLGTEKEESQ